MSTSTERKQRPPSWPRMRPRFILDVDCGVEDVMRALADRLPDDPRGIEGHLSQRHGVLSVSEDERMFWSAQLGITVEERPLGADEDGAPTRVLGIFSPFPEIWTAFVFAIGTLTAVAVFALMCGVVQLSMGWTPWAFVVSLIAAMAGGLVYTSTLVGQGLAAEEMHILRAHLAECLDLAQERASRAPRTALDSAQL